MIVTVVYKVDFDQEQMAEMAKLLEMEVKVLQESFCKEAIDSIAYGNREGSLWYWSDIDEWRHYERLNGEDFVGPFAYRIQEQGWQLSE